MTEHRKVPADGVVRRKRLIYRSKQRGWLEVDLLLGSWATQFVPGLTEKECDDYEHILNCETIDIFNFITGKDACPPSIDTPIMANLQAYCRSNPIGTDPLGYERSKTASNLT
jgi:succinate dehydrogenase assembly factor 2